MSAPPAPPYRIGDGVRIVQGSPYGSEDGEKVIAGASAMPVGTPYDDATNPQILRGVRGLAVEGIAMHEHFVALSVPRERTAQARGDVETAGRTGLPRAPPLAIRRGERA